MRPTDERGRFLGLLEMRWEALIRRGRHYKLSEEDVRALVAAQDEKCPLCQRDILDWTTVPVFDHDHSCCGQSRGCRNCVRGILCKGCNSALGRFGDSVERLTVVLDYVRSASVPGVPRPKYEALGRG